MSKFALILLCGWTVYLYGRCQRSWMTTTIPKVLRPRTRRRRRRPLTWATPWIASPTSALILSLAGTSRNITALSLPPPRLPSSVSSILTAGFSCSCLQLGTAIINLGLGHIYFFIYFLFIELVQFNKTLQYSVNTSHLIHRWSGHKQSGQSVQSR